MKNRVKHNVLTPPEKKSIGVVPYLTFPLTKKCLFKCIYCGEGGENTASLESMPSVEFIKDRTEHALAHGIRKFRLTGGEPMLHPQFDEILDFFASLKEVFLLVNTNGALATKKEAALCRATNAHFATSLDSLQQEKFDQISRTKGRFKDTVDGIRLLSEVGRLFRLNMVVNRYNIEEVAAIIDFCHELRCNLKLLDVVSVPAPFFSRDEVHVCLDDLEQRLEEMADTVELHQYARAFGTPCKIYIIKGVRVTVKSTSHGSHYDLERVCNRCHYFPCHEGLYDLFMLPDGRLCGCRWSESSVSNAPTFADALTELTKAFQRADWVKPVKVVSMEPYPDFIGQGLRCK